MVNSKWGIYDLRDIRIANPYLLQSLFIDYEAVTHDYGWMSIADFLNTWTALTFDEIAELKKNDTVFGYMGAELVCMHTAQTDDDGYVYVEVANKKDLGTTIFMGIGELYSSQYRSTLYISGRKKKPIKEEEKLCPILITKTKRQ